MTVGIEEPAGIRIVVPPELEHARLVRSLLRFLITFRDEDHESRFLLAATEIVLSAVDASRRAAVRRPLADTSVVIELPPPPIHYIDICDSAGGFDTPATDSGHLGAGLAIAQMLVGELSVHEHGSGTRVRLELAGPAP